jgi:ubiquinone/menaquinone biosynthesis C-methylase UbiE
MAILDDPLEWVREYYGKILQRSSDLKTSACCPAESMPPHLDGLIDDIEPEILERFYGCGAPIPYALEGCTVLDLGCGSGRDVYLASRLVGEDGRVIGVDMTEEQLEVAKRCLEPQMQRYGYSIPNVEFRRGFMEDLEGAGIEDESVDVVISDCVINLSPEKERVFAEVFRVLKPGGELYFSDVFADRRLPAYLMTDPVLHGECLAGAMYEEDFRRVMHGLGYADVRCVCRSPIRIESAEIEQRIGLARFSSITVRAFKLNTLEDRCEDYGQMATYLGTIEGYAHRVSLDDHHEFETGKPMCVCGNTAAMLSDTRLSAHFSVQGDRSKHFGLFDCGAAPGPRDKTDRAPGCC